MILSFEIIVVYLLKLVTQVLIKHKCDGIVWSDSHKIGEKAAIKCRDSLSPYLSKNCYSFRSQPSAPPILMICCPSLLNLLLFLLISLPLLLPFRIFTIFTHHALLFVQSDVVHSGSHHLVGVGYGRGDSL